MRRSCGSTLTPSRITELLTLRDFPDFLFPSHFLKFFRRDPEAFPSQPRDVVSPACPGSSSGSLSGGTCPEHLTREASGRHPDQMPQPPHPAPLNAEELRLNTEPLPDDRASRPTSGHPASALPELSLPRFHAHAGEIVSTYRKCHLFDVELPEKGVSLNESAFTIPGDSLAAPVQTPVGQLGLGVCYDLRFPEFSLALRKSGADILTFPSAFTEATGAAHWEVLLRARAIENQCYVLAAAQVGRHHAKRSSYGHALAVDPWGAVIADCGGERAGVALVEVDLEKIRTVRGNMPLQKHRREAGFYASPESPT
ncbi:deaminated glutathione amidase isoform X2 [Syngnathoides biaculeatus]|uniref:deaminated glutathione amidase isoform X2 n=1 Tax=Syngnathoides biaculeatus TaxID=300417 RepID=UPI002ADE391E|nr:deaminated glutathione amidase isoform X2 [Syngnathoides biaculeatus]XP_061664448.1 deaminated glutathione amidase isoform X2 [Syngnathoides biaculeatus]